MLCVGACLSVAMPALCQSQVPVYQNAPQPPEFGMNPYGPGGAGPGPGSYGSRGMGQGLDMDIQTYSANANRPPSLPPNLLKQFMDVSGRCNKAAQDKLKAGDNLGAARMYQSLAVYRERVLGRLDLGASEAYFKACLYFERVKHYQEAEAAIREALIICNTVRGTGEPQAIPLLARLGAVLNEENKPTLAKSYLEQALTLEERKSGPSSKNTLLATIALADTYYKLDDFNSAEPLYERSIEVAQKSKFLDVDRLTAVMNSYSGVLRHNDKLDQATQVLLDIKAMRTDKPQKVEGQTAQSPKNDSTKVDSTKADSTKADQDKPVAATTSGEKTKSEGSSASESKPAANSSSLDKPKSDSNGARETAQK